MSAADLARPGSYSWIARVYTKNDQGDYELAGCGVVIDETRVLTCAHVVGRFDGSSGWVSDAGIGVAFPKNDDSGRNELLPIQDMVFPDSGEREDDLAVLYLSGPLPAGVKAAPLRCPEPGSLASGRWQVLGFPDHPAGESASGTVEELARGWVRLNKESGDRLRQGFSGSGVWSAEYQAVVAVVTQAGGGDGRAITLHQANGLLPQENLADLARWSLAHDREAEGHWEPRARGASIGSYPRPRFRGRKAALLAIKQWLDRDQASRRVLVVTGAPGAGKSAVLARVVTTASPGREGELPASDNGIRATAGSVGCAVHAKGKTALEVATEVARAASTELPDRLEDFGPILRRALAERRVSGNDSCLRPRRFNVIIDALDEAFSPEQARIIINKVIMPVAETCADTGAQVIVGSRRTDAEGDLLGAFGSSAVLVDLDGEEFFAREDLAAYALATLQLADREQGSNPYADAVIARPVADRIAELSDGNFLVAGLTAQAHGLFDTTPVDPAALSFSPEVTSVMREYLRRIPHVAGMPEPAEVLTALAFAQAPGFPTSLWRLAIQTLDGDDVPEMKLARFARSQAASFLLESSEKDGQDSAFRLFHQALNDALLAAVDPGTARRAEQALTRAFLTTGQDVGWERSPAYLLRSLPTHAARAGLIDDLLADDAYLLHADLRRVLQVANRAVSPAAHDRARLLGLTPEAATVDAPDRAALFSVTEALDGLGTAYRSNRWQAPYRAQWAVAKPRDETIILDGHESGVKAICVITVDGKSLLASGSTDKTVRLWDPATGTQTRILEGHQRGVYAMGVITVDGRPLLATASTDKTIRLWDPATGQPDRILETDQLRVNAICAVAVDGRSLLAVGSSDGTVRIWDPATGTQTRIINCHQREVRDVCVITVDGRTLLATMGYDEAVRVWDPATGTQTRVLRGDSKDERHAWVRAICVISVDGRTLLAASRGRTVRLWDPVVGKTDKILTAHRGGSVEAMCAVSVDGCQLLATVSDQQTVRLWDAATSTQTRVHEGRRNSVEAISAVAVDGRSLLATCSSYDRTVRLWDPVTYPATGTRTQAIKGHQGEVKDVCPVAVEGRSLLATCSNEAVLLWDTATGIRAIEVRQGGFQAICAVAIDGRTLLATSSSDGTVRVWDPSTGAQTHILEGHQSQVHALSAVAIDGRTLLAISSGSGTVRLWEPDTGAQVQLVESPSRIRAMCTISSDGSAQLATGSEGGFVRLWNPSAGTQIHSMEGHQGEVTAMCAVTVDGKPLLATGSGDKTIRVWDPDTGAQTHILEGHHGRVHALSAITVDGRTLLATGGVDRTVRLWDLTDGRCTLTVPVHYAVLAVTSAPNSLAVGLAAGVLVIKFKLMSSLGRVLAIGVAACP